jgi:NhaP-type Na+/H+ and K+/H+ antiporter
MLLYLISILLSQLKSNLFSFNKSFTIVLLSIVIFGVNIISADIAVVRISGTRVRESRSRSGIPTLEPDRKHSRVSRDSRKHRIKNKVYKF